EQITRALDPTSSLPAGKRSEANANELPGEGAGTFRRSSPTGRGDSEEHLETGGPNLLFMASSGGLKSAQTFRGRDASLSGPAGGVVGMAETAKRAGFPRVIGFDMGGTSTDVAHFAGAYERAFETQIAGVRLAVPMLRVHTVAAGGGSIVTYDGT